MTIRIGVIGAGMIGEDHVRRITDRVSGARVTSVTDIDAGRADTVASAVAAKAVATGNDIIDSPDVDAVMVTSSGATHVDYVLASIAAGKPVFCEKPLATTAVDCLRIVEAERAGRRRLVQVGFMRRYDSGYREMKRVIDSGELGAPLMAHCVHRNVTAGEAYISEMATYDTAIHEIDVLRWLLDDEIVSVQVVTPRRTSYRFDHLIDPQIMLFETATGVRLDVEVFVNCQYGYDIQCEVVGETGLVRLPEPAKVWLRTGGQQRSNVLQHWKDRFEDAYDVEIQEWVDSVAADAVVGPSSWDGYAAAMIGDRTVEALRTGEIMRVGMDKRPAFYG